MKSIASKMVEVMQEIGFIEFDSVNNYHSYKYASAASIIRKLQLALIRHKVFMYCEEENQRIESGITTSKMFIRFVDAESGESVLAVGMGSGSDKGDKASMKASTAAFKYAIAHTFCLGWGAEDPEEDKRDLLSEIKSAKTEEELNSHKEAVAAQSRNKKLYKELCDAFRTKGLELKGKVNE